MAPSKDIAKNDDAQLPAEMLAEMEAASQAAKGEIDLQQDVRLPSLQLIQATTKVEGDARPGQILDTLSGDAHDEVEVIPVATFKTRAFFGGGSIGDPPTCTSPDALNGYGEVADQLKAQGVTGPDPNAGDCTRCPQADWRRGGKCQLRFNYLTVLPGDDMEHQVPRGVMMHGTSAKIASRLNTMLLGQKFFWGSTVKLSSTRDSNDRGQYYVWSVAKGRPCEQTELLAAFQMHKQFEASRRQGSVSIDGDPAAGDGAKGDDDIPF